MTEQTTQNLGHILQKGQIFGIDSMISFTIMLFCVLVFATTLSNESQNTSQNLLDYELEEKALLITDSLVKNHDENNPLLGSCIIDTDKKRVLTNILDIELIRKSKPINLNGIFAKQITVNTQGKIETIKLDEKNSNECIAVKRFAMVNNQKSILEMMVCRT